MRLIDADKLAAILEDMEEKAADETENDGSDGTTRIVCPVRTTTREMLDLIADQPTVEAVPSCTLEDGVVCSPYGPHDPLAVTMTVAEWNDVRHTLEDAANVFRARALSWRYSCQDKKMGAENAASYEEAALHMDRLAKIIDCTIFPPLQKPENE